jgi:hypothetical protein
VRKVPIDPGEVYDVMECAYRHGVLDKSMVIQGEALEAVMQEADLNMGDLLNRMDEAEEATVQKVDKMLDRLGPFIKYANNDKLMKFVSRILDIPFVKRMMVQNMKKTILKVMTGESPPSLGERIKAALGKAA